MKGFCPHCKLTRLQYDDWCVRCKRFAVPRIGRPKCKHGTNLETDADLDKLIAEWRPTMPGEVADDLPTTADLPRVQKPSDRRRNGKRM